MSAADLPICFGIVRWVGPDRVGEIEHAVLEYIRKTWHTINPLSDKTQVDTVPPIEDKATATVREGIIGGDIAHAEAAAKDGSKASEFLPRFNALLVVARLTTFRTGLWTELVLAYAIHKSLFVFIRVPLTIAVTPKVVKTLRGWGWEIGKRRPKVPKA